MSAETTSADGGTEDETSFEPDDVRRRLPSELTDKQERAMICAVRNPDASFGAIAEACGVNHSTVAYGLRSLARGILGRGEHTGEWIERREGVRKAEAFGELSDKQRVVVDFLARHPEFDPEAHPSRELREAVETWADDAPDMHDTYPKRIAREYAELVEDRREQLLAMGEDLNGEVEDPDVFDPDTPREFLDAAGITELPEANLDSLAEYGDTPVIGDEERLRKAFENATTDVQDAGVSRAVDEFEDHRGETRDEFDDDDVELGTGYVGVVNGKVGWGVWVTIGGDPDDPADVSGVIPKENLADHGQAVDDYEVGDEVRVVAVGRSATSDSKVRHRFDLPTTEDEDGAAQADEADEAETPYVVEDGEPWVEVPAERLAELTERLRAVERGLDRVGEQASENAEALPTPEQVEQLNEAAETVLGAEGELSALADRVHAVEDRVNRLEQIPVDTLVELADDHHAELDDLRERVQELEQADDHTAEADDLASALGTLRDAGAEIELRLTAGDNEDDHDHE